MGDWLGVTVIVVGIGAFVWFTGGRNRVRNFALWLGIAALLIALFELLPHPHA